VLLNAGLPRVGDRILVRAVLCPPMKPVPPDTYPYKRRLYFERIGAVGLGYGQWRHLEAPPAKSWTAAIQERTKSVRRTISARVAAVIPERDRSTVSAVLIMGAQSAIPQDLQEAYRVSGLAHLLSISGVHMGILAPSSFPWCVGPGDYCSPIMTRPWLRIVTRAMRLSVSPQHMPFAGTATLWTAYTCIARALSPFG